MLKQLRSPLLLFFLKGKIRQLEGSRMEEVSKTLSEMQQSIASKLSAMGADSIDKAVTAGEANLDVPCA
ncbi:MAG: hypothetical protein ABSD42_02635 [Candidatus Bathyarchaeia archaeon]